MSFKIYNIDRESDAGLATYLAHKRTDSLLFKAIEAEFDKWIENYKGGMEYSEMYFSEDAIYSKKGAIHEAIEMIFEIMDEYELGFIMLDDQRIDVLCAFAG